MFCFVGRSRVAGILFPYEKALHSAHLQDSIKQSGAACLGSSFPTVTFAYTLNSVPEPELRLTDQKDAVHSATCVALMATCLLV